MIFQLSQAMAEIKERGRADFFFFVVLAGLHIVTRLIDMFTFHRRMSVVTLETIPGKKCYPSVVM